MLVLLLIFQKMVKSINVIIQCIHLATVCCFSEMLKRGIVDQLLSMITKPREMTVVCSVMALSNIANDESSRSELIGNNIISTLVGLLHSR